MLARIALISTILILNGCFKALTTTAGSNTRMGLKKNGKVVDVSTDKSSIAVSADSTETLTFSASSESALAGTSVAVSPKTFSSPASLVIEAGVLLSETSVASEVGLTSDVFVQSAASGVIVRPSENVKINHPLTIALPLPLATSLNLTGATYAVYFKHLDPETGVLTTGIKQVGDANTLIRFDEVTNREVVEFQGYFGSYWVVTLSRPLQTAEIPAPKATAEPIINKAQAVVIAASGVVDEKKVLETQALPPPVTLEKPKLTFTSSTRSINVSLQGLPKVTSCKADLFEKASDVSGLSVDTSALYTFETKLTKPTSHTLFARYRCLDDKGRSLTSPWSEGVSIPEYPYLAVKSISSSNANGVYSTDADIVIIMNFAEKVVVRGSPRLRLNLGTKEAMYASGSGSSTLYFQYKVAAGDESSDLDVAGASALIFPVGSGISDSNEISILASLTGLKASDTLVSNKDIVIDTLAPTAPSSVGYPSGLSSSTSVTVAFASSFDTNFFSHEVKLCAQNDCSTSCSASLSSLSSPATVPASSGATYFACVRGVDAANLASAWVPAVNSITVDSDIASVVSVSSTYTTVALNAGGMVPVTVEFSAPVYVSNGSDLSLLLETGTTDRTATYLSGSGTDSLTFSYYVQAGDASSDLEYASINALSLGASATIKSVNNLDAVLTLPAPGSANSLASGREIIIDTIVPSIPSISSLANSYQTSVVAAISGTSEAGAMVEVKSSGLPIGSAIANASGIWVASLAVPLADGTYSLTASATDAAGNASVASTAISFEVDTSAPAAPVLLSLASPSVDQTPTVSGTSEPNVEIKVYYSSPITLLGSTVANASGAWSLTIPALADDNYSFMAKAYDSASRSSTPSNTINYSIDVLDPTAPSNISVPSLSNSTTFSVDFTNGTDPNFSHHNVKLCTSSDCSTSCGAPSVATSSPANVLGVNLETYYACVQAEDTLGHTSLWVGSPTTVEINSAGTTVTSVTSSMANGVYNVGQAIPITVTFSSDIVLTNNASITLNLETGTTDRVAVYGSSTSNSITFDYVIQSGDNTADLDYISTAALNLGSGTITDLATNPAILTLPPLGSAMSLAGQKALVVDTTAPSNPLSVGFAAAASSVLSLPLSWSESTDANFSHHNVKLCVDSGCSVSCSSFGTSLTSPTTLTAPSAASYYGCVQAEDLSANLSSWIASLSPIIVDTASPTIVMLSSSTANGTYAAGASIFIEIQFSEAVHVLSGNQLALKLETGGTDRFAEYLSGSGSSTLTFNYTVSSGDVSSDLEVHSTSALTIGTGSVVDLAGNDALLTLPPPGGGSSISGQKSIVIAAAGVAPNLSAGAQAAQNAVVGTAIIPVNINDGGDDYDGDNQVITYSCKYDQTPNGIMDAGGTDCSTLGATFNPSTGQLNWTPTAPAAPNASVLYIYEFKVTGTDTMAMNGYVYFTVDLINPATTSIGFDAGDAASYAFDPGPIDFSGGFARLKEISQMDSAENAFAGGSFQGANWFPADNFLRLGNVGPCDGQGYNCFGKLDLSWLPSAAWTSAAMIYNFESSLGDFTVAGSMPILDSTEMRGGKKSASFDGSSQRATIPRKVQDNFTINFWMKTTSTASSGSCVNATDGVGLVQGEVGVGVNDYGISLCDGYILFGIGNPDTSIKSSTRINDGKWHMITAIRMISSASISLAIDGVPEASASSVGTQTLSAPTDLVIGGSLSPSTYYQGNLDELAFWSKALPLDEVGALYRRQASLLSGAVDSRIMDATVPSSWSAIEWRTRLPAGKELPSNAISETGSDYADASSSLMNNNIGLWHFNENVSSMAPSAKDFEDKSGNSNHGMAIGPVQFNHLGRFIKGIRLNGNASVNVGSSTLFNFPGSFTQSFWVKIPKGTSGKILSSGYTSARDNGLRVEVANGNFGFGIGCSGGAISNCAFVKTTNAFDDGAWHNLVVQRNLSPSVMKIFVDGVAQSLIRVDAIGSCGSMTNSTELDVSACPNLNASRSTSGVQLGSYGGTSEFLKGSLDEVAFWSRALSASEVSQLNRRGATRLGFQIRSCASDTCSGTEWAGPDGTSSSFFSEIHNKANPMQSNGSNNAGSPIIPFSAFNANGLTVPNNRYFQYRAVLESDYPQSSCTYSSGAGPCSPELTSVAIKPAPRFNASEPLIRYLNPIPFRNLSSISFTGVCSQLRIRLSIDNSNWWWWDGSSWQVVAGTSGNTVSDLTSSVLSSFKSSVGSGNLYIATVMASPGTMPCNLDSLNVSVNASH